MYFPEPSCPFYRVTYLSNYSPHMTPGPGYYSLLCETSYSEFKPVNAANAVEETLRGLVATGLISERDQDDIVSTWLYDAGYSYPIPTVERDRLLGEVVPYLERQAIYPRGRFGLWKYEVSNTDHSLMQGVEVVDRLLQEKPEVTVGTIYPTGIGGSERVLRPIVAGSGDPGPRRVRPSERAASSG
jgi:hypothetical protein